MFLYFYLSGGGLENPAYDLGSQAMASHPDSGATSLPYTSQQDFYAHVGDKKTRRNRMKNSTAAAIAAQKNRTTSVFDDTDMLIDNDAVVVYDERTAL